MARWAWKAWMMPWAILGVLFLLLALGLFLYGALGGRTPAVSPYAFGLALVAACLAALGRVYRGGLA